MRFLGILLALAFPLSAVQLLAPTGQPFRAIVKANGDARAVDLAAHEMQTWLEQEFGTRLEIVPNSDETPVIRLGSAAGLGDFLLGEPADAFCVRTAESGDLLIAGVDNHGKPEFGMMNPWRDIELMNASVGVSLLEAAGTANGVYAFLEKHCGIRFYGIGPDGTDVPELTQDLQLGDLDYRQIPHFAYRYPWISFLARDSETAYWQRRIGFGGAAPVQIIHAFRLMNDSLVGRKLLVGYDLLHDRRDSRFNTVVILIAAADCQISLRVAVDEQYLFAPAGKSHAEVEGRCRLSDAALLICHGDHFTFIQLFCFSPSLYI